MRPMLCEEALRLGRVLAGLAPQEPEVHGLVALMEIQASRFAARTEQNGEPILLLDQDRSRWDQLLIRRGLAALERAETGSGTGRTVHAAGGNRCVAMRGHARPMIRTGSGSRRSIACSRIFRRHPLSN